MKYRWVPFVISLVLLVGLLIYSDFFKVVDVISKSNLTFVSIGLVIWCVDLFFRSFRWKILLKKAGIKLRLIDVMHVYIPGLFLSNISPAKTGDVLRPVLLKTMKSKSISKSTPSIIVERSLDVFVLVLMSISGLYLLSTKMVHYLFVAILFYSVLILFAIITFTSEKRTKLVLTKVMSVFSRFKFAKKINKKILYFSKTFTKSFKKYKDWKVLLIAGVSTFVIWFLEGSMTFIGFKTIGVNVDLLVCIFVMSVSVLISVVTLLPGGLGINEGVETLIFTSLYGLKPSEIMAALILARFYGYWMYIFLGAIILSVSKHKSKII